MNAGAELGLREIVFSEKEAAEAYLEGIADSISAVDFGEGSFFLNYAGGTIGRCSLHRGATSQLSYQVSESGDLHFVVLQNGGMRFSGGRRNEDHSITQRSGLMLGPGAAGGAASPPIAAAYR